MTLTNTAPASAAAFPGTARAAVNRFEVERVLADARASLRNLRHVALAAFDDGAPLEVVRDEVDDVVACCKRSTSVLCLLLGEQA